MKLKASSGKIVPSILDLSNLPTIKPAVAELQKQFASLNIVFLNAGVMTPPPNSKTTQNYDLQWVLMLLVTSFSKSC